MDLLADYWKYNSCYEIPRNYSIWSALGLVGAVMHKKVQYNHGRLPFSGCLYVGLIGKMGNSKSVSNDFAKAIFEEVCPDANIGPSRASPESLVKLMKENDFERSYTDPVSGEKELIRPFAFFVNEFKNFLGRSPVDMINLITDIYDRKFYDASSIARDLEVVMNPAINLMVCETPEWMIDNMKGNVITGGIARRFILVYENYGAEPKPFIIEPPDSLEARARVIQRLKDIKDTGGLYKFGDGANVYEAWYRDNFKIYQNEKIPMMQGYLKTKNTQLYKVMMLLDSVSDKPMRLFTKDLVDYALTLFEAIEPNMPVLGSAAGRNELSGAQQKILQIIRSAGGIMPEKRLKREIEGDLNSQETYSILRHLTDTEQLIQKEVPIPNEKGIEVKRVMLFLPDAWLAFEARFVAKPSPPVPSRAKDHHQT